MGGVLRSKVQLCIGKLGVIFNIRESGENCPTINVGLFALLGGSSELVSD